MFFIYCFSEGLKEKLLNSGFRLVTKMNNIYIFENKAELKFNFDEVDKAQYAFSNKIFI
jgi:hypothetical protein